MVMGPIANLRDAVQTIGLLTDFRFLLDGASRSVSEHVIVDSACFGPCDHLTPPLEGTSHVTGTVSGSGTACAGDQCYRVELRDCEATGNYCEATGTCQLYVRLNDDCRVFAPSGDLCAVSDCSLVLTGRPAFSPAATAGGGESRAAGQQLPLPRPASSTGAQPSAHLQPRAIEPGAVSAMAGDLDVATGSLRIEGQEPMRLTGGRLTVSGSLTVAAGRPPVDYVIADRPSLPPHLFDAMESRPVIEPAARLAKVLGVEAREVRHAVFQNGLWTLNGSLPAGRALARFESVVALSDLSRQERKQCSDEFGAAFSAFVNFKPLSTPHTRAAAVAAGRRVTP